LLLAPTGINGSPRNPGIKVRRNLRGDRSAPNALVQELRKHWQFAGGAKGLYDAPGDFVEFGQHDFSCRLPVRFRHNCSLLNEVGHQDFIVLESNPNVCGSPSQDRFGLRKRVALAWLDIRRLVILVSASDYPRWNTHHSGMGWDVM